MANDSSQQNSAGEKLKNMMGVVPLFSGFPEAMVSELQKAATLINFSPDQVILKQGEINRNLFFLVIGTVEVFVDDGLVASLRRKGDLLGEMSVITNKPCSATIVAKTPVELICINIAEFKNVLGDRKDQFDHILYRIYSQILTDKVSITNDRAKKVESALSALERAKAELQDINTQMERRVVERTQSLQAKLQELLNEHLLKLQSSLKVASAKSSPETKMIMDEGVHKIDEVVRFLEPLVQRFNLEVSMKNKRVLLAQGERKAQTLSRMALGGTGIAIDAALTFEESQDKIKNESYDVVLVDSDTISLTEAIQKKSSLTKIVYIAAKGIHDSLPKLLNFASLPNIVIVHEDDRAGSIRTIMTTVTKLCSPNIFGLEKYLNVGVDVKELKVEKSTERDLLNNKMREHFLGLGVRNSVLDSVSLVLEELLMNAIYDAPTDVQGHSIYNNLPRTTAVNLKPSEHGLLRFATDGTLLAISVQDPFGSLTAKIILKYLDSCYGGREGSMQTDKGGAGRGLHQIIESSTFVVFNVQAGKNTEVLAFFDVVPGKKEALAPMLHYFVQ